MGKPTEAELRALTESGPLLRFAAEKVKDLDPDLSLAIAEANESANTDAWTPQASQSFWRTFNRLCTLIQPTTMECLAARAQVVNAPSLFGSKNKLISLAERSSDTYRWALLVAILIAIPLQLYVWSGNIELKNIADISSTLQPEEADFTQQYHQLQNEFAKYNATHPLTPGQTPGPVSDPDLISRFSQFLTLSRSVDMDIQRLAYVTGILQHMTLHTPFQLAESSPPPANSAQALEGTYSWVRDRSEAVQRAAVRGREEASLAVGLILSFILPLLFGVIGAIGYVVRSISDEITATTFSPTAPSRYLMRVTLGALAGVVVGFFTNISAGVSLSPLALAFLAGYGVEALFAMFDNLIAKFKD
jgi:hypothetical protein